MGTVDCEELGWSVNCRQTRHVTNRKYTDLVMHQRLLDGQTIIFGSQFGILKISHFSNLPADNSNFEMLKSLDKNLVNQLYDQLKGFFISEN